MINGRQPKQDARQDNQKQGQEQSLVTRAIDKFVRDVQEACSNQLHGSLRLVIGFKGGVPANVEFDKHESMR